MSWSNYYRQNHPLAAVVINYHHEISLIKPKEKVLDNIMLWINTTSFKISLYPKVLSEVVL